MYTSNEQIEKEHRKTTPFITATKKNQIPMNKIKKDMNDLYKENYRPLKKEIEEDCRR
jgi:hypothetical protein